MSSEDKVRLQTVKVNREESKFEVSELMQKRKKYCKMKVKYLLNN